MSLSLGAHTSVSQYVTSNTPEIETSSGSCIIVALSYEGGPTPPTVSDSKGNTWTQVGSPTGDCYWGYNNYIVFFKNESGSRGSSHTFTTDRAGTSIWVQEILGNSPVVDNVNDGVVDSSSPYQSNPYTPSSANEYLLCITAPEVSSNIDVTWGGGFASTGNDINSGAYWYGSLAYRLISEITSYVASATYFGTTFRAGFLILGVKETAASGGLALPVAQNYYNNMRH